MAVSETVSVDLVVNTQNAQSNMVSFSRQVGLSVVGIQELVNMAKAAASAIVDFAQESVALYADQESAVTNLDSVLRSTQGAVGMTSRELQDLATNLQKTTLYGDETTIQAEALMLTFRQIGSSVFPQAIKAAQDMATVMKMDLNSATIMIGKALNEPIQGIGALRRVGVQLTDQQEAMIKKFMQANDVASAQAVIMQELNSEFGGAAEMAGKMATGSLVQLKNAFGDVKEEIGRLLVDTLRPSINALKEFFGAVAEGLKQSTNLKEAMSADLYTSSIDALSTYASAVRYKIQSLRSDLAADVEGLLSGSIELDIKKYEDKLNTIYRLLQSRGSLLSSNSIVGGGNKNNGMSKEDFTALQPYFQAYDDLVRSANEAINYGGESSTDRFVKEIDARNKALEESIKLENEWGKVGQDAVNTNTESLSDLLLFTEAMRELNNQMAYAAGNAFITSMQQFGEDAYRAGISINTLGAAISNMGQSILNMLPQLFLQAGLQLLIASNGMDPRGWALIAMAGTVAVTSGYVNAAVEDSKTSKSVSPSVSASSNVTIHNYSGQQATVTETPKPGGGKITEIVIGAVKNSMANGGFDSIMSSRYGARYAGVRR